MSSPATETPRRSTEIKQVNPNVAATAKSSDPPASLNSKAPPINGTDEGTADSPNGNNAQGMSAALMATEPPAPSGDRNRSNAIDRQLEDDSRRFKKECKILLLGEGLVIARTLC